MELLAEVLLEEIEAELRRVALDPAITSNPGARGEDAPLAVLV